MSGDNLQRPVNIILDVRVAVAQSATNYQAALHGLIEKDKSALRKEWHVQVLAYYREISRYSSKNNISDMWHEPDPELDSEDGNQMSLEEIRDLQFESDIIKTEVYDNRNKTTKIVEQERMTTFPPETLMSITAKLDRCVAALGFDAAVRRELPTFGHYGFEDVNEQEQEKQ